MESGFLRRTRRLFEARAVFLVIGMTREQLLRDFVGPDSEGYCRGRCKIQPAGAGFRDGRLSHDRAGGQSAQYGVRRGSAVALLEFWPNLERRP